ncbi:MAG: DUF1993 domain-containing protein [Myxococcota bacterium]
MNAFDLVKQCRKMLSNLDSWIGMAVENAAARSYDPNHLVTARLAPDMFTFAQQVQSGCDAAKYLAAYLTGTKAPSHPDTETTIAELRARIAACGAYLDGFKAEDFDGAADRKVSPPWLGGKWVRGEDYALQAGFPNFLFHMTTAYAILRHNGVPLGKQFYIGSLPVQS